MCLAFEQKQHNQQTTQVEWSINEWSVIEYLTCPTKNDRRLYCDHRVAIVVDESS